MYSEPLLKVSLETLIKENILGLCDKCDYKTRKIIGLRIHVAKIHAKIHENVVHLSGLLI